MKTQGKGKADRRAGFSMIEVLVASTILVVIVMMLSMLFQQTSLAWRTGVKRASGYMQIRSALGAIQRDASAAVDARTLPDELKTKLGGDDQQFRGSLSFYTLTGTGKGTAADPAMRAPKYITYNISGTRSETALTAAGAKQVKNSNVLEFVKPTNNKNSPTVTFSGFEPKFVTDTKGLPLYVTVKAQVTTTGNALDIGAASAGPDKTWGTADDIKTWVDTN